MINKKVVQSKVAHLRPGFQVLALTLIVGTGAFLYRGSPAVDQATIWVIYGLFAVSIDILWGYCGMLTFGQAVFFGLGAMCYAWTTTDTWFPHVDWNPALAGILLSILLPALLGLVLGYFLFYGKVRGPYFVIVTLALAFLMQALGNGWTKVFGGFMGFFGVPTASVELGGWSFGLTTPLTRYITVSLLLAGVVVVSARILRGPFGLRVAGVRDNDQRLEYLGTSTVKTKLVVFIGSAAIAGFAGALFASTSGFVSADLMGTLLSTEAVIWVAIGGRMTLIGAVLGAVVVRGFGYIISSIAVEYWTLFLGALFIFMVLFGSKGLWVIGGSAAARLSRLLEGRRGSRDIVENRTTGR